ncbi:MAG TPA: DMT family transporter [Candidatus Nanopelagicales bacterium]|nr:DMT family transporter [Candidatus Nanopelagicales bacterium]
MAEVGTRRRAGSAVYAGAAIAMVAFAANSLLTRGALDDRSIGAGTFSLVRLVSGAVVLVAIARLRAGTWSPLLAGPVPWRSAAYLFGYVAAFSFAYLRLGAATGALVLFGTVQVVLYGVALRRGERPGLSGWTGLVLAFAGLVALVAPGVSAPDAVGVALMVLAGVSWAAYTLAGRGSVDPILTSARNFAVSVPLAVVLELVAVVGGEGVHATPRGLGLAVLSGAVASGLGYALWYSVLPWLTRVQSGILQMAPTPLAAVGGLLLLGEPIGLRVVLASLLILTGVAVGVIGAARR